MHLASLRIENLRGIVSQEIDFFKYTCLIGPNNCCKSTVLRAIQIVLNQDKPEVDEWNCDAGENDIIIEARFVGISEEERLIPGIAGLVHDKEIRLRAVCRKADSVEITYQAYIQEEQITGFAESWAGLSEEIRVLAATVGASSKNWRTKATREKTRDEIRLKKPELVKKGDVSWTDDALSINEALKQGLPRVFIVPAVRDAKDDSKITRTKNNFGDIFKEQVIPELEATAEYKEMIASAQKLRSKIRDSDAQLVNVDLVTKGIGATASELIKLSISLSVELPELEEVFGSSACLVVNDGRANTPVHLQGHGAQRSIISGMIQYVARRGDIKKKGKDVRSIILLFEEPELYIHPQLLRALKASLIRLGSNGNWQVIVTTHSPIMIDVADHPQSLVIFRRDEDGALQKKQLKSDPFANDGKRDDRQVLRASLDFHPTVCEAFFADNAVLVEGDSEMAVLSWAKKVLAGPDLSRRNIDNTTVVGCDGKWTILPICRLLLAFGIPVKVVHDTDDPGDLADDEKADDTALVIKANEEIAKLLPADRIFAIQSTLEDILYEVAGTRYKKDKPIRAWRRMRRIVESNTMDVHNRLLDLFEFVFPLSSDLDEVETP